MSFIFKLNQNVEYVFLHIPKNGGNSVVNSLCKYNIAPKGITRISNKLRGHFTYLETNEIINNLIKSGKLKKTQEELLYFCVIRNPWERMVSFYSYISQNEPGVSGFYELHKEILNGASFDDFVVSFINDGRTEFRPQINYITNEKGDIVVDCLVLDGIEKNLINFLKKINTIDVENIKIGIDNKSKHDGYNDFYKLQKTIDIVAEYECGIIDKFNFKF